MPSKTIRYTGDGTEYLFGIPARDLTADDQAALTAEQRALVAASPLYDTPAPKTDAADVQKAAEPSA